MKFCWNCAVEIKALSATQHSICFSPLSTGLALTRKLAVCLHYVGEWQRNLRYSKVLSGTTHSTSGVLANWQTHHHLGGSQ